MRTTGNILWLVFSGSWLAVGYALSGAELIPVDEVLAEGGDDLDDVARAALHQSIDESIEDEATGNVADLSKIIAELRARL